MNLSMTDKQVGSSGSEGGWLLNSSRELRARLPLARAEAQLQPHPQPPCTHLPGILILLLIFFAFLHCWLNAFAEMLRFGDRMFYRVGPGTWASGSWRQGGPGEEVG